MSVVAVGGAAGLGVYALPLPVFLAIVAVGLVLAGAIMIRLTFRRRRPVGQ